MKIFFHSSLHMKLKETIVRDEPVRIKFYRLHTCSLRYVQSVPHPDRIPVLGLVLPHAQVRYKHHHREGHCTWQHDNPFRALVIQIW